MSLHRYARTSRTPAEKEAHKIATIEGQLEHARSVLAWQVAEGYEEQAAYSRQAIAKLESKLAKLV